ncbi:hypothetical protein TSAR_009530 [Trichomalopsis sarcophagae]|uniref:Uncharacterized protein n=1 Tax=Trichomalopsis sarcophagae TaxID=543379 RepID=A0A232EEJ9_9HYME|nr:hypothetical protein TSAR_009530 [Trichomalopsis sarcophagae]
MQTKRKFDEKIGRREIKPLRRPKNHPPQKSTQANQTTQIQDEDFKWECTEQLANPNSPTTQSTESAIADSVASSSGTKPTGAHPKTTIRQCFHY